MKGILVGAVLATACTSQTASVGEFSSTGTEGVSSGIVSAGPASSPTASSTSGTNADPTQDGLFDVSAAFDVGGGCKSEPCLGCNGVDILFVIDNSESMGDYQTALAEAFPAFAEAIFSALPPNTSVHVGITSTTMGHSDIGMNSGCAATGDGMMPAEAFYTTPLDEDTGVEGAQGRLFVIEDRPYFEASTSDPSDALAQWFMAAAPIGEGGSQIEMSGAAAAWATHAVNDATNGGFVRDKGAVLVLFFIQDEPDQTPPSATADLIAQLTSAKENCGGMSCVVAGGFVETTCLPENPLGSILDAAGDTVVQQLPSFSPDTTAATFEQVLRDTLATLTVDTCASIPSG